MLVTEAYIVPQTFDGSQSLQGSSDGVVRLQLSSYGVLSSEARIPAAAGESEVVTTISLSLLNYDELVQVLRLRGAFALLLRTPKSRWYAVGLFPGGGVQIEGAEQTTGEAHSSTRLTLTAQSAPDPLRLSEE